MAKKYLCWIGLMLCVFGVGIANAAEHIDVKASTMSQPVNFFWQSQNSTDHWMIQMAGDGSKEVGFVIQVNNFPVMPGQVLGGALVEWVSHGMDKSAIVAPGQVLMLQASNYLKITSADDNFAEGLITYLGIVKVK